MRIVWNFRLKKDKELVKGKDLTDLSYKSVEKWAKKKVR